MSFDHEKSVLRALAARFWRERGPGVLVGRVEDSLILDIWLPLQEVRRQGPEKVPGVLAGRVRPVAWRWLRQNGLSDTVLGAATGERVPIVFCLPLPKTPYPEIEFFTSIE